MLIGGFQKTSLIDYPKKIAAIVFAYGCNFRCHYCHNPELVRGIEKIADEKSILNFLDTRKGKLDGVVVTGGEPCLQRDLPEFLQKIKDKGFSVKLDTNGSKFDMLETVVLKGLVDYIAMDIKAPLTKYKKIIDTDIDIEEVQNSIELIMACGIDYEFRTTVVDTLLTVDDFEQIGKTVEGAKKYFLQKFVFSKVLDESFKEAKTFSDKDFEEVAQILLNYNIEQVQIR